MVQRVSTVAFEGIEARAVDVQVQVATGRPPSTYCRQLNLVLRSTNARSHAPVPSLFLHSNVD